LLQKDEYSFSLEQSFIFRNLANIVKIFSLDHALQAPAADLVTHCATDDGDALAGRHGARRSVLGDGLDCLQCRRVELDVKLSYGRPSSYAPSANRNGHCDGAFFAA
jgi:hypothetical protein